MKRFLIMNIRVLFPLQSSKSPDYQGFSHFDTIQLILDTSMNAVHDYKECEPNFHENDLSKRWYFDFYAYSKRYKKVKRHRIWIPKKGDLAFRLLRAESMMKNINDQLKKGMVVNDMPKPKAKKASKPVLQPSPESALGLLFQIAIENPNNVSDKQISAYKTAINNFSEFLDNKEKQAYNYELLSVEDAFEYLSYLQKDKELMPRTINNNFDSLKHLSNILVDRKKVSKNIFDSIKSLKEADSDRHEAYSEFEQRLIEEDLKESDMRLFFATRFVYYAFIRPKELRTLTVGDIDFRKGSIMVKAGDSKNQRRIPVPIVQPLQDIILKMGLHQKPSGHFVFGKDLATCDVQASKNEYLNRHNAAVKKLGIYRKEITTFYAWKHTGNVIAFLAGVDIWTLKEMNRHWSIVETEGYLRKLGLILKREAVKLKW